MSGIQTNFRAEDMLGGAKPVAVAPKKVAPKATPKVEAPVEVVVEAPVVEESVVVEASDDEAVTE